MDPDERAPTRAPSATEQAQSNDSREKSANSLADVQQKLLRALADNENLRRQARRQLEDARRFAISEFAGDLLATADTLELALASASDAQRTDPALAPLIEGIEATRRVLLTAFSKHGVSRSEPLGESFDPHLHHAGFRTRGTGHPPDTVTEVARPGYIIHGRVLRPPLVGVSSVAPNAGHEASEAQPAEGKANADTE